MYNTINKFNINKILQKNSWPANSTTSPHLT